MTCLAGARTNPPAQTYSQTADAGATGCERIDQTASVANAQISNTGRHRE